MAELSREQLLVELEKYEKLQDEYRQVAQVYLKQLSEGCLHERVRTSKEDRDDGYGRWWRHEYQYCTICWMRNDYGRWYKREVAKDD